MLLADRTTSFAGRLIENCDLDSLSVFQCDRGQESARLTYFLHVGVPAEAQSAYSDGNVFEHDPFTNLIHSKSNPRTGLIRWEDHQLAPQIARAPVYRSFINSFSVDVVGAHIQILAPNRYLLVGVHRRPGRRARSEVDFERLETETAMLANMVVSQMLTETLRLPLGHRAFEQVLGHQRIEASPAHLRLSQREAEITVLVCAGRLNKQIAVETGLSEYTVENYLRRIYRKLNIHNRAALVSIMLGSVH